MSTSSIKPVRIDLRDTLEPIDPVGNDWIREWAWLSPIHERGFTEFEVVSWELCYRLERTIGVVTVINKFNDWYDIEFVVESVRKAERKAGVEGYTELCRAAGVPALLDLPQILVGKKFALRVLSADGDVQFKPLSVLEVPASEFRGFLRRIAA